MQIKETPLKGLFSLESEPIIDHRGFFTRAFCQKELAEFGLDIPIMQANISLTHAKGAVRGLHFQYPPHAEVKIVRCISGAIFDVAVDLRKDSPTFLQWHSEILTAENNRALYIPHGFAHGFQALEAETKIFYMVSEYYNKESESAIRYNDPLVGISWPLSVTDLSERDKIHTLLDTAFLGIRAI